MRIINHISSSAFVGLGLLLAAPLVGAATDAQAQAAGSVPPALIQSVDQAAVANNAATLKTATLAVIAAAQGDQAALIAAVTAAVAADPSQADMIVAAFASNSAADLAPQIAAAAAGLPAVQAIPGEVAKVAGAAAAAAPTQSAAISVAVLQALPATLRTTDETAAVVAAVNDAAPGAGLQTGAIDQLVLNTPGGVNVVSLTTSPVAQTLPPVPGVVQSSSPE